MFEIFVEHTFASAHFLRNYKGKCENLHGELDQHGMLFDFADLKQRLRKTSGYLDHQCINELKPFDAINPSAENIAKFIFDEIQRDIEPAKLAYVRVWETDTSCAVYRR